MSVSDQITGNIENDKYEDEIVFKEPSGWLLSHDILETIGYSIGFLVFLGILALILYLKCRNKQTSTTLVPWFDNLHRNVQMLELSPNLNLYTSQSDMSKRLNPNRRIKIGATAATR